MESADTDASEGFHETHRTMQVSKITSDAYLTTECGVEDFWRNPAAKMAAETIDATTRPFIPVNAPTKRKRNDRASNTRLSRSMAWPKRNKKIVLAATEIRN